MYFIDFNFIDTYIRVIFIACFWLPQEIDLKKDEVDWSKLTEDEKKILKYILAFFASSDTLVNENLSENFIEEVQPMEAKMFFNFQRMIEVYD